MNSEKFVNPTLVLKKSDLVPQKLDEVLFFQSTRHNPEKPPLDPLKQSPEIKLKRLSEDPESLNNPQKAELRASIAHALNTGVNKTGKGLSMASETIKGGAIAAGERISLAAEPFMDKIREKAENMRSQYLTIPLLSRKERVAQQKVQGFDSDIANLQMNIDSLMDSVQDRAYDFQELRSDFSDDKNDAKDERSELKVAEADNTKLSSLKTKMNGLQSDRAKAENERTSSIRQRRMESKRILTSYEERLKPFDDKIADFKNMAETSAQNIQKFEDRISTDSEKMERLQKMNDNSTSSELKGSAKRKMVQIEKDIKTSQKNISKEHKNRSSYSKKLGKLSSKSESLRQRTTKWDDLLNKVTSTTPDTPPEEAPKVEEKVTESTEATKKTTAIEIPSAYLEAPGTRKMKIDKYVQEWNGFRKQSNDLIPIELDLEGLRKTLAKPNENMSISDIEDTILAYDEKTNHSGNKEKLESLFSLIRFKLA